MTDESPQVPSGTDPAGEALPPAAPVLDEIPPPPPPPPRRRGPPLVPWVFALAFIVLGWAVMFLWLHPTTPSGPSPEAERVATLAQQVQTLDAEAKQLAARPVGQPEVLAALGAKLADLAARKPPAPDLSGLEARLSALEQRQKVPPPTVDLAPLQQKLAGVEQQVAALAGVPAQLGHLAHDQQALAAQVQALTAGAKNADSGLAGRIDEQGKAIDALQGEVGRIDASLGRTTKAARAEAALVALQAGRPLGAIPDAPPAAARFATEPPPTVSSLRRAFPAVALAALAASRPDDADKRFLDRVWTRAQNLVTVRQGDHVLVGDPAAGVIARAKDDIDAGDVAGAVDALATLSGPAGQAVAGWLGSARALLEARAALIGMAAGQS